MANWFVRSSSAGSNNGTDWSNAWNFTTLNTSWASVNPGDTIWLAGGTYAAGIRFGKDGTAGNYIYVKRATASDPEATGSTGWDPAFDSQVIIGPTTDTCPMLWPTIGTGSYIYIDGRTHNGIKCKFDNTADAFLGAVVPSGNQHDIVCAYMDLCGPGTGSYGNPVNFPYAGDTAALMMRNDNPVYNITISHCDLHSSVNLVYSYPNAANHHITFEYCRFYDNSSSSFSFHANMIYNEQGHDWIIRYCDFSGWQVEGIMMFNVGASAVYEIYGNVFHDPAPGFPSCFWPGSNADPTDVQGALSLYNNTFVGVPITTTQGRSWPFGPDSIARNNIYWDSTFADNSPIADSDYNFSNLSIPGANSISNGENPFSSGTDYHITGYLGADRPRNNGVALASPYDITPDGNTRGADGNWDMGAYEYVVAPGKVTYGSPII